MFDPAGSTYRPLVDLPLVDENELYAEFIGREVERWCAIAALTIFFFLTPLVLRAFATTPGAQLW